MDAASAVNGLILVLAAFWVLVKQLLLYLLSALYLLASPFLYIGHGLLTLALFPLRILLKLEAFVYFITGAVLAGITVGLFLHFAGDALSQLLQLHSSNPPPQQADMVVPKDPPLDWGSHWRDQHFPSTILEEEENSQGSG